VSERGFTLLEVLAAAMILAIAYTALLGMHIEAARAEGRSLRHIDAGLIAEEKLADLEARLKPDEKIERIEDEGEVDGFKYTMTTTALAKCMAAQVGGGLAAASDAVTDAAADAGGEPANVGALLAQLQGMAQDLVCLQVVVSWPEGETGFGQIQRVSFAFDRVATLERLQQLQQGAQGDNARDDNARGGGIQAGDGSALGPGGLPPGIPRPQ